MRRLVFLLAAPAAACSSPSTPANAEAVSHAVGERPRAIITADFNGDGLRDIATANADSDNVSVLLAGMDGVFTRADFPAGNEPADIATADFDRDGTPDLAIANHETSAVTILLNDGSGGFTPMPGSPFETDARPHLHSVAVGDFDGDGFADLASDSSETDSIAVLFGREGGFHSARQVDVGEFPYYRLGTLPTETGTRVLVPSPRAHRVSEVDPSRAGSLSVIGPAVGAMMARSGSFSSTGGIDAAAIVTDGVVMWRRTGAGFARITADPVAFDNPTDLAVGDLDGDGRDEIIVSVWESDQITILSPEGERIGSITACFRPAALHIADLDGDKRGEILAGCWNEPKILVFDQP